MIERHLKPVVIEALRDFPVVAVLGARQTGKTTLVQALSSGPWPARYLTLDDRAVLDAVLTDPDGFVDGLELPVILDEVQRAPDLLRSVKRAVDRDRRPGMFLLTGSANVLTMRAVSESLAGRVALLELHPFSMAELARSRAPSQNLENLFRSRSASEFLGGLPSASSEMSRRGIAERILSGGYPVPALMKPGRGRVQWFESYRATYLERDLREIARVMSLPNFGRLLTAAALRTGQILNTAGISRDLGIPMRTVRRHLGLLETTYQVTTVRPYYRNVGKRLVKRPKLYFTDTGLAAHLTASENWDLLERQGRAGAMVETFVAAELRKLAAIASQRTEIHFWQTHAGREVDFLLVRGDRLVAIEVKWAQRVSKGDVANLESCRRDLAGSLGLSVLLYSGTNAFALDDHTVVVPFAVLLAGG
jgi:predicted AAA+ superfamily ATPase